MASLIICLLGLAAAGRLYVPAVAAEEAAGMPCPHMPCPHMQSGAGHEGMDARTPLPLTEMMAAHQKQNMRDHLAAVQAIVAGLAADDMSVVEQAARRIGYSDATAQMCEHMGAGAPAFIDMALSFHRTADTIADAAQRGDRNAATTALAATLSTCVGCHATYRQEVVDQATGRRLPPGSAK